MAKKREVEEQQLDLFPADPEIRGLSITQFKLKDGSIDAGLTGATLVGDIALLNDHVWRKAIAEWLVNLCGNGDMVQIYIDEARAKAHEAELDRELARAAMEASSKPNVVGIGQPGLA